MTRRDDWEDQDGAGARELETQPAWSRRALFGASGGLALAASGLLLPEWLVEEAAADNHPVRGVLDRKQRKRDKHRHKLKHNRRLKRRRLKSRRQTTDGVGAGQDRFLSGIRFHVYNDHSSPSHVDFYQYGPRVTLGPDVWQDLGVDTIQPGGVSTKNTVFQGAAVLIEGYYWIMAYNPALFFPTIFFAYGGRRTPSDKDFHGYERGKVAFVDLALLTGNSVVRTINGRRFTITRNPDEGSGQTYISFDVRYT